MTAYPQKAMPLSQEARQQLLQIAKESIRYGLEQGQSLPVQSSDYSAELQAQRASFVTLNRAGQLRGCIGHLEAVMPLVADVAANAYAAAFQDPRFTPLHRTEFADLAIHLSVLTPAIPLEFSSEADLLKQIRPGIDGLILQDGFAKGTFLPSVWESLPEAKDFWQHLKRKAGLPINHWSDQVRVWRYETESF